MLVRFGPMASGASLSRDSISMMPTEHILALLIQERDKLNRAIDALQGPAKRPGRPAVSVSADGVAETPKKKRTFSAAQRKKQAERMKAYWAAKRKSAK